MKLGGKFGCEKKPVSSNREGLFVVCIHKEEERGV